MATATSASGSPSNAPSVVPTRAPSKSKQKKLVTLSLPSSLLAEFPSSSPEQSSKSKPTPSMPPTSPYESRKPPTKEVAAVEETKPTLHSPQPNGDNPPTPSAPTQVNGAKRKAPAGGDAAAAAKKQKMDENGLPKPRGKPGPKRRKGVEGEGGPAPTSHKTNPKANAGAINANLRALDLTGTKTRRWGKKGLQFNSFTGFKWNVDRWNTNKKGQGFEGDVKSETTQSSEQPRPGPEPASSVLPSDRSNNGDGVHENGVNDVATPNGAVTDIASSPPPQPMEGVSAA